MQAWTVAMLSFVTIEVPVLMSTGVRLYFAWLARFATAK